MFPLATVTSYHKPGDLKQHRSLLSQFWRPKSVLLGPNGDIPPEVLEEHLDVALCLSSSGGC